jgi:hypothetical protein
MPPNHDASAAGVAPYRLDRSTERVGHELLEPLLGQRCASSSLKDLTENHGDVFARLVLELVRVQPSLEDLDSSPLGRRERKEPVRPIRLRRQVADRHLNEGRIRGAERRLLLYDGRKRPDAGQSGEQLVRGESQRQGQSSSINFLVRLTRASGRAERLGPRSEMCLRPSATRATDAGSTPWWSVCPVPLVTPSACWG